MNVKIWDDKYMIKSDARQYKLIELKNTKPGEGIDDDDTDVGTCIGYFTALTHLFQSLVEREGRLNKCSTLEGYIKHIEKINDKLEENLLAMAKIVGQKESFKRIMDSTPEKLPDAIQKLGEPNKKKKTK